MCASNNNHCNAPPVAPPGDEIIVLGFDGGNIPDLLDGSISDDEVWEDLLDLISRSLSSAADDDGDGDGDGTGTRAGNDLQVS